MPSVILTILKVIGIILLVLLLLVLTVLLLVLFVPVRYRVSGSYEDAPEGEAYVTWLLRLIGVRAGWKDGLYARVRVLCFNVWSMDPEKKPADDDDYDMFEGLDEAESLNNAGEAPQTAAESAQPPEGSAEGPAEETDTALPEEAGSQLPADTAAEEAAPEKPADAEPQHRPDFTGWQAEEAEEGEKFRDWEKEPKPKRRGKPKTAPDGEEAPAVPFDEKIDRKAEEIRKKLEALADKAASLKKKADGALSILNHRRTRRLKDYLILKIKRILKEILPRKYGGFVRFGFDDPAATGSAASAAALIYPVIQDRISVEPLFDRQEIAADLSLKGRIRLFVLVLTAAQVWFNRDFQYVFKRVKKYRKSLTEEDHG